MLNYWENRSIELERLIQDRTDETVIAVNMLYKNAFDSMDASIRKILYKFSFDSELSLDDAVALMNLEQTKEIRNELFRIYNNTDDPQLKKEVLNRLKAPAYAARIRRIEALKDIVYYEAKLAGSIETSLLHDRLIDTYEQSYYRSTYNMQVETGLQYNFTKLTNKAVKSAISHEWKGSSYSKRVWNNTDKLADELSNIIEVGLMSGQSQRTMLNSLMESLGSNRYVSNRVIRTEVAYICGQARIKSYTDAEIEKYIFIATLDLKTSLICRSLDHEVFPVSEASVGINFPPMHPHCRSTDSAYVSDRDMSKLKRRAKDPITGKTMIVPKDMSYKEWYEKYVEGNEDALKKEKELKRSKKKS